MEPEYIKRHGKVLLSIFEKLLIAAVTGLVIWMFTTVATFDKRLTTIEQNSKENAAQWGLLQKHSKAVTDLQIQIEVNNRLFEMLVRKQVEPQDIHMPEPEAMPEQREETLDEFMHEQKTMHNRRMMQQRAK